MRETASKLWRTSLVQGKDYKVSLLNKFPGQEPMREVYQCQGKPYRSSACKCMLCSSYLMYLGLSKKSCFWNSGRKAGNQAEVYRPVVDILKGPSGSAPYSLWVNYRLLSKSASPIPCLRMLLEVRTPSSSSLTRGTQ